MSTSAIVLVQSLPLAKLFEPDTINPILERIKAEARATPLDISTDSGRKEVASLAYKIARTKTFIDEQRKVLVSDEKKKLATIDAEGKRIRDELDALKDEVRKPLTDWEDAEASRVQAHEAALSEIIGAGPHTLQNWQSLSIEAMQDRLSEIRDDSRDWQEFSSRAKLAKETACSAIASAIEKRKTQDAERAELERMRAERIESERKQREAQIAAAAAAEAEAKAKREAEQQREKAERESREREARAIREKENAEKAAAKANAERTAAILKAQADTEAAIRMERERVEQERQKAAAADAKRESDTRHRRTINTDAAAALVAAGFENGTDIVEFIAKGMVPHVRIIY